GLGKLSRSEHAGGAVGLLLMPTPGHGVPVQSCRLARSATDDGARASQVIVARGCSGGREPGGSFWAGRGARPPLPETRARPRVAVKARTPAPPRCAGGGRSRTGCASRLLACRLPSLAESSRHPALALISWRSLVIASDPVTNESLA